MAAMEGVSMSFVRELKQEIEASWTTEDTCQKLVLPLTVEKRCSLIQLPQYQKTSEVTGKPLVGKATVFVSHAWRYNCCELLSAVLDYGAEHPDAYFWIDVFCNNQHSAPNQSHDWWSTTFKNAIASMGQVLLVLSPWNQPIPLTRAWCLWEMVCGMTQEHVKLEIALPRAERRSFHTGLATNFTVILDTLTAIDTRNADATNKNDKTMIFQAIEESLGFTALNTQIKEPLREWYLDTTIEITEAMVLMEDASEAQAQLLLNVSQALGEFGRYQEALRFAARATSSFSNLLGEDHRQIGTCLIHEAFCLLYVAEYAKSQEACTAAIHIFDRGDTTEDKKGVAEALLLQAQIQSRTSKYKEALKSVTKSLEMLEPLLGQEHELVASCYNQIGNVCSRLHQPAKSIQSFRKSLEIRKLLHGDKHPHVAQVLNNLANSLVRDDKPEEALKAYEESLQMRIETLGKAHSQTAASYNNLGNFYADRDFPKAMEYYKLALATRQLALGHAHPEVAASLNNIGGLLSRHQQLPEAEKYFREALELRLSCFSEMHLAVAATRCNLGRALSQQDRHREALVYLLAAYNVRKTQLPPKHIEVQITAEFVADAYEALGEYDQALDMLEKNPAKKAKAREAKVARLKKKAQAQTEADKPSSSVSSAPSESATLASAATESDSASSATPVSASSVKDKSTGGRKSKLSLRSLLSSMKSQQKKK